MVPTDPQKYRERWIKFYPLFSFFFGVSESMSTRFSLLFHVSLSNRKPFFFLSVTPPCHLFQEEGGFGSVFRSLAFERYYEQRKFAVRDKKVHPKDEIAAASLQEEICHHLYSPLNFDHHHLHGSFFHFHLIFLFLPFQQQHPRPHQRKPRLFEESLQNQSKSPLHFLLCLLLPN